MDIEQWNLYSKASIGNVEQIACGECTISIDEAVRRLNALTDALAFYASPSTYIDDIADDHSQCGDWGAFPGAIARKTLGVETPTEARKPN